MTPTTPTKIKTVHIIFNAHLDPIWLWSWRDGLDEVLNTSYYICNLLDRHPDIIYNRGEAWVYEQIQRLDPALFERIRVHVKNGRWNLVGGWYVQPDCNLPSGFAMERQIALGKRLFGDYFNSWPKVAYNVDSFGHAATLPGLMRKAGQPFYVMMRPQEQELKLPARLFRWRGYADGPEVTTFRIAQSYTTAAGLDEAHIRASLTELPETVHHTLCFVGIGDHGGGPTESMIEWCRAHRESFPGIRLEFSTPQRFFVAIAPEIPQLPLVVGELQIHAVGCYSVHRPVKVALRKAEHRLTQAQIATGSDTKDDALEAAWKRVCFHHFHDTFGGTCLPSAFQDVDAQLGQALAAADETAAYALRRRLVSLAENPAQRIVLLNASDHPFNDYVEVEPFLEWTPWKPSWRLIDEKGRRVACQVMHPESTDKLLVRLLFPVMAEPGEMKTLRIVQASEGDGGAVEKLVSVGPSWLQAGNGPSVNLGAASRLEFPHAPHFPLPQLATYEDRSDTWSHGIDRYTRISQQVVVWEEPQLVDQGPLMGSLIQNGKIGASTVQAEWRVYHNQPWVELLLRVLWAERFRILKLEWELPLEIAEREDGIMGGSLIRPTDGRESPLRDWVRLHLKKPAAGLDAAVICPDVFALDAEPHRLGFTLLRSSVLACQETNAVPPARGHFSDRGEHFFRFRFVAGVPLSSVELDQVACAWQRPLLSSEVTRGMKTRFLRGDYAPPETPILPR